eukprot:gnl/MRDRNA2_/MRDRNA2_70338_c0_seq1.p1 gnl/MRDRNA2_/MRDRNA2_70338_c0~~gnl/MRDRNA2_/MRDRNA2_70338_c0_seq1.p1  ORF type:complete len:193 (+),score=36.67 gnl/MRDRNA2_/MRDRNA2_70338_c0_seq1:106-684(+)
MARLSILPGPPTREVWKQLESMHSGLGALEEVVARVPMSTATPGGRAESALVVAHLAVCRRLYDIRGPLSDLDRSNLSVVPGEKIYIHPSKVPEMLSLRTSQPPALPKIGGDQDIFDEVSLIRSSLPTAESGQHAASKRHYEECLKSAEVFRSESMKMFSSAPAKRIRVNTGEKLASPAPEILKGIRDRGVL